MLNIFMSVELQIFTIVMYNNKNLIYFRIEIENHPKWKLWQRMF